MKRKRKWLTWFSLSLVVSSLFLQNCNGVCENNKADNEVVGNVAIKDVTNSVSKSITKGYALNNEYSGKISASTKVDVIVELKDDAVIDKYQAKSSSLTFTSFANESVNINYANSLLSKQDTLFNKLSKEITMVKRFNYTTILNGFAATVNYGDIAKIEKNSLVKNVIVSEVYEKPEITSFEGGLPNVTENNVNVYETGIYNTSNLSYDGTNTVVAILDTGLDYTHPAFQIQPTGTLAVGREKINSLVSSTQASVMSATKTTNPFTLTSDQVWISNKVPFAYDYADMDADVYPINDHGTHVAGIVAGKDDVITGVATNAQLAIMKVFPDSDEGAEQISILAALSDCVLLGVDVINMSLGSSCGFSSEEDEEDINAIYDSVKESGISLVVAASNDYSSAKGTEIGDTNLTSNPDSGTVGSPGSYDASYTVASISGVKTSYGIANEGTIVYFTESSKNATTTNDFLLDLLGDKESETYEYVTIYGTGVAADYIGVDVKGKIALVRRGVETFEDKIKTAQKFGAIAIIIYNNISGEISMSVGKDVKIPSCSISMDIGNELAEVGEGTITFSKEYKAGPFMSGFSSWGTLPDLTLKPDIAAHGGEIYSAVRGGYDTYSGTSMACPNMAGATLLVRQYIKDNFKDLDSKEIAALAQQLTMSTATIALNQEGNPYSPRKQGAGLADILSATTTKAYLWVENLDQSKISYGDDKDKTGEYTFTFNLTNLSSKAQSYTLNPYVFTESVSSDGKTVAEKAHMFDEAEVNINLSSGSLSNNGKVVTIAGYNTTKVTTTIKLTDEDKAYLDKNFENGMFVEGYIQFLSLSNDTCNLSIPYCAFYGDWTVAPMLDYTAYEIADSKLDDAIKDNDKLKAQAYGSIPMGGFSYTDGEIYSWGLGDYGYNLAEGYEKPEPQEKYASISLNPDATFKISYIAAGLLRGAKQANMIVVNNETGEIVFEKTDYNSRKSYYSGARNPGFVDMEFDPNEYGLKNNTKYTIYLETFLDYEGKQNNKKNTAQFTFTIDSEAPIYKESVVRIKTDSEKNNTYYLDMYVYDNHYIQCYTIGTYKSIASDGTMEGYESLIEYTIPVYSAENTTNRISFDITNYMEEIAAADGNLYVEFIDYAKNTSNFTIKLPHVDADAIEIAAPTNNDGEVIVRQNAYYDLFDYVTLQPETAWYERLIWESADETIAQVFEGEVFGVNPGVTTIKAISAKDSNIYKEITVRVNASTNAAPTLKGLELNKTSLKLDQGESYTLKVTLNPWNLPEEYIKNNVDLKWTSNTPSIATVEVNPDNPLEAIVTAKNEGSVNITVTSGALISSTCRVTVKELFEVEGAYLRRYHGRGDENGVVEIPDDLGIVYIYQTAFFNNPYIKKIIIPEGVEQVMYAGIYGNDNLEEIVLPSTCHTLNDFSMAWNPKLKKVNLENVTTIFKRAFIYDTALSEIDLSNVHSIGYLAFYNCTSLTSIDISSCGSVGEMAFAYNTSLREIKMTPQTSLGTASFYNCSGLTNLIIPTISVGYQTFAYCTSLKDVVFTNDVTYIDSYAFYNCTSLANLAFKGNVGVIKDYAFCYNKSLKTLTLPNGLTELGELAFGMCSSLNTVKIPANCELSTINRAVFGDCNLISTFSVEDGNPYLISNDGILYDSSMTTLLLVPQAKNTAKFTVPQSVVEIGDYAFAYNIKLIGIDLSNVRFVGEGAFYSCTGLKSLTANNVEVYKDSAFVNTLISKIVLNENVRYIGESAFYYNNSTSEQYELVIPSSVEYIGFNAFGTLHGITSVKFENNMKSIPGQIFANCVNLASVTLPSELEEIGEYAFYSCTSLTNINLPETLTTLNEACFAKCSGLTTVNLPSLITNIPESAYRECTGLVSIVIPESINEISGYAFYDCKNLVEVDFSNVETVGSYAFVNTKLETVTSQNIKTVNSYAFSGITTLTNVSLANAKTIGMAAFSNDTKLSSVDVSNALYIGSGAFYYATSLKSIDLPEVQDIGVQAFMSSSLETLTMPKVVNIYGQAFAMTNLTTITIPKTCDIIDLQAFGYISTLEEIIVEKENNKFFAVDGVLYSYLENGYYELNTYPKGKTDVSYTIIERTARINDAAFGGNTYLKEVVLPASLKSIGQAAFTECSALTNITFNSVKAPILETVYDKKYSITYDNFIASINNGRLSVNVTIPSNGIGYDNYIYSNYFNVNNYTKSEAKPDADVIEFTYVISDIDIEQVDKNDVELENKLITLYDAIASNMKSFVDTDIYNKYLAILEKIEG